MDMWERYRVSFVTLGIGDTAPLFNQMKAVEKNAEANDEYKLCPMPANRQMQPGYIYLTKDSNHHIRYSLITPVGEPFQDISTDILVSDPQNFDNMDLDVFRNQIVEQASNAGYIRAPGEKQGVYEVNNTMRGVIQQLYYGFDERAARHERRVADSKQTLENRGVCFYEVTTLHMRAIDFFQTIENNLTGWGFKSAMRMATETLHFTPEERLRFHQDRLYNFLRNMPHGIQRALSGAPAWAIETIQVLRPEQQIELFGMCLDRRTVLGTCFWNEAGSGVYLSKRQEVRSLLEKLDSNSPALKLKNVRYATCRQFRDAPECTVWHETVNGISEEKKAELDAGEILKQQPHNIYLLEKEAALKAIKAMLSELPDAAARINLLKRCLDPLDVLGNRFWEQERGFACKITWGTLKDIDDLLKNLESRNRPDPPGRRPVL